MVRVQFGVFCVCRDGLGDRKLDVQRLLSLRTGVFVCVVCVSEQNTLPDLPWAAMGLTG